MDKDRAVVGGSSDEVADESSDLAAVKAGQRLAEEAAAMRGERPGRIFLARLLGVHTDERAKRVGAAGERKVADRLGKLGPNWHVLHSIVLSAAGTDLDHLVIGPGGVYCINTKNHPGKKIWVGGNTVMVSGQRQTYVAASRSEAKKVAQVLTKAHSHPVMVFPVIVIANGELNVKTQPEGVRIASRQRIVTWLKSRPVQLTDAEAAEIYAVSKLHSTWNRPDGRGN
jgi:Nuclease-related domain